MNGRARAHGAVSVLNAVRHGIGGAVGIALPVEVEVGANPSGAEDRILPADSATPIVRAALEVGRLSEPRTERTPLEVRIRSEVPVGCGLKSSSAVAVAVLSATRAAFGRSTDPEPIAQRVAAIGRAIGQSATGAFDDNLACAAPGVWITDNRVDTVLRHDVVPADLEVVLWIPPGRHPPSPSVAASLRSEARSPAIAYALAGDPWKALEQNGTEIEEALGLPPTERAALHELGARAAGVTGLGPARAAVVPHDRADGVRAWWSGRPGRALRVPFAGGPGDPTR